MVFDIVNMVMIQAKDKLEAFFMSLLLIEGRNIANPSFDLNTVRHTELETMAFIAEHRHLLDCNLIPIVETFQPLFQDKSMNTPLCHINLYIRTCNTLISFQSFEQSNGGDNCSEVILAVVARATNSLIEYQQDKCCDRNLLEYFEMALLIVEAKIYHLKNTMGEPVALKSLDIFDRTIVAIKKQIPVNPEFKKLYYSYFIMKAFAHQQLGQFNLAMYNYRLVLPVFLREEDPEAWADIKLGMGICWESASLENLAQAIECYQFARSVFEENSELGKLRYKRKLGLVYYHLSQAYGALFDRTEDMNGLREGLHYGSLAIKQLMRLNNAEARSYCQILNESNANRQQRSLNYF
jgi:tetratricopeptide (TPR) repeat protein